MIRFLLLLAFFTAGLCRNSRSASTNDFFAQRIVLSGASVSSTATFTGATREEAEPDGFGGSLWWEWKAPINGPVAVEAATTSFPVAAMVFKGEWPLLTPVSSPAPVISGGTTPFIAGYSKVAFRADQDVTYYIAAGGFTNYTQGTVTLRIKPGPTNDDFANATAIPGTNIAISAQLHGATREPGEPLLSTNSAGASVWWKWSPQTRTRAVLSATTQDVPIKLALYRGEALSNLVLLATAETDLLAGSARIVRDVDAETYYVSIADAAKSFGNVTLKIQPGPANDDFANRSTLAGTNVVGRVNITGATREEGEPLDYGGSVWWEWTAPFSGGVAVEGLSTTFTAVPAVFEGIELTHLRLVSVPETLRHSSKASFRAEQGKTYIIALLTDGNASGTGSIRLNPGPSNDDFALAPSISGTNVGFSGSLHGATLEPVETRLSTNGTGASVWWLWRAGQVGGYSIDVQSPSSTPLISVFRGSSLTNLIPLATGITSNGSAATRYTFRVDDISERFAIRAEDVSGYFANFTITIRPGPSNDDFEDALEKNELSWTGTTRGATSEPGEPFPTTSSGQSVWYRWVSSRTGGYEVQLGGGGASGSRLVLFSGNTLSNLTVLTSVENSGGTSASIPFRANSNEIYYFMIDGKSEGGDTFSIGLIPGPANDDFFQRALITTNSEGVNMRGASREAGEPPHNGQNAPRTVWYEWRASQSGGFYLSWSGGNPLTDFAVYRGVTLTNLTPVASRLSASAGMHRSFSAVAGETYLFALSDWNAAGATVVFSVTAGPENDSFSAAKTISGVNVAVAASTLGATREEGEPESKGLGGDRLVSLGRADRRRVRV